MNFSQWIDTFIEEKGIDLEHRFNVKGPKWGWNSIPIGCVVEALKDAPKHEQSAVKSMLVKLDFLNMKIVPYFEHLAKAIAQ